MATTILTLIAGALAALASAVQVGSKYTTEMGKALQHGRVALERIQRALNEATASEQFPGFVAFSEYAGSWEFPDTLVVWHPSGLAANPEGLPLRSELVVFCPDPVVPNRLLELTLPEDDLTVPALCDTVGWQSLLQSIKTSSAGRRVVLTDVLRIALPTGVMARETVPRGAASFAEVMARDAVPRGAARFIVSQRPSETEWDEFLSGLRAWEEMSWVQDIHGTQNGLRQSWCRIELQLSADHVDDNSVDAAIPFFGSGAIYFSLKRPDGPIK